MSDQPTSGADVDAEPDAGPDTDADLDAEPGAEDSDSGDGEDSLDGEDSVGGLSWGRALVLAAALAFLGFAVGVFVSRDTAPGEGTVDVGFYQDMITHHEQALSVATLELAHGEDATVRSFAREVLTFQSYEIGVMRQTLGDWGYAPGERPDEAMGWMGMSVPVEEMIGLLSDADMDEMNAARGREADALFLELMAEHHRGGLHMAEYASGEAGDGGVRELAARMVRNQSLEINEYRLLAEREGYDVDIPPADVPPDLPT